MRRRKLAHSSFPVTKEDVFGCRDNKFKDYSIMQELGFLLFVVYLIVSVGLSFITPVCFGRHGDLPFIHQIISIIHQQAISYPTPFPSHSHIPSSSVHTHHPRHAVHATLA